MPISVSGSQVTFNDSSVQKTLQKRFNEMFERHNKYHKEFARL